MPVSLQDQQLAEISSRGATNLGEAWRNWSELLMHCPDEEAQAAAALELAETTGHLASLILHWHEVAELLLPAQSARLRTMSPEYRITASEVARRLGSPAVTTHHPAG